jgi:hypothetical protein
VLNQPLARENYSEAETVIMDDLDYNGKRKGWKDED